MQGELPSAEELAEFDAILFTGGAGDAFSDEQWVVQVGYPCRNSRLHARLGVSRNVRLWLSTSQQGLPDSYGSWSTVPG